MNTFHPEHIRVFLRFHFRQDVSVVQFLGAGMFSQWNSGDTIRNFSSLYGSSRRIDTGRAWSWKPCHSRREDAPARTDRQTMRGKGVPKHACGSVRVDCAEANTRLEDRQKRELSMVSPEFRIRRIRELRWSVRERTTLSAVGLAHLATHLPSG